MADRYQQFTKSPVGKFVVPKLGLPNPATLRRYKPGQPALEGPALLGAAPGGRLEKTVRDQLADAGIEVVTSAADRHAALVFDATGVTDPSRGIGAAIAEVLARDGAHVVALDIPAQGGDLSKVANKIGGSSLQLDITSPSAPAKLAEYLKERHGGVDVVVHNAGITRDK